MALISPCLRMTAGVEDRLFLTRSHSQIFQSSHRGEPGVAVSPGRWLVTDEPEHGAGPTGRSPDLGNRNKREGEALRSPTKA